METMTDTGWGTHGERRIDFGTLAVLMGVYRGAGDKANFAVSPNGSLFGYDLGSEPTAQAAAEEALRTFLLAALKKLGVDVEAIHNESVRLRSAVAHHKDFIQNVLRASGFTIEMIDELDIEGSEDSVVKHIETARMEAVTNGARAAAMEAKITTLCDRFAERYRSLRESADFWQKDGDPAAARWARKIAKRYARRLRDTTALLSAESTALDAALEQARKEGAEKERVKTAIALRQMRSGVWPVEQLAELIEKNRLVSP